MQIELTLTAPDGADYSARDLGFLLHKHPDHLHTRETGQGIASIFYTEKGDTRTTAILHLALDPVALVRGKNAQSDGLLAQYVNDRPYVANSFLSVALARSFGQTLSGKSKERQALADRPLPFEVRVIPVAIAGGADVAKTVFEPLGYHADPVLIDESGQRGIYDLRLKGTVFLRDVLSHLYVLVPVLDNAKHWFIDKEAIEKLLAKGEGWLPQHPAKTLITTRALKHRRALVHAALERLADEEPEPEIPDGAPPPEPEEALEKPMRLHDLRLDTVAALLLSLIHISEPTRPY